MANLGSNFLNLSRKFLDFLQFFGIQAQLKPVSLSACCVS